MGGNRKRGFMRGSAAGRNGSQIWYTTKKWYCEVCNKEHSPAVVRTQYQGKIMCDRQYFKLKEEEFMMR
jgi:hypothetical protein